MDPRKEVERYTKILEVDPHSQAFAPLAEAYRKLGEIEKARHLCEEGLKTHPNYPTGRAVYGRILLDLKDYPNAKKELARAVQLAPDNILALKNLARCLMLSGEVGSAAGLYEKVLAFNAEDVEAKEFFRSHPRQPAAAAPAAPPPEAEFRVVQAAQVFKQEENQPQASATAAAPVSEPPIQTETLARLYLQQGHPEKALAMLGNLLVERGVETGLIAAIEEALAQVKAQGAKPPAKPAAVPPQPVESKTAKLGKLLQRIGERKKA